MKYALITDCNVGKLYGDTLYQKLKELGYPIELYSFPVGETYKNRETKQSLEDQLLRDGYRRDTVLIALGGGVVTDLVGFLASTFCRGVPFIAIPTTLLAMIDATVGGKTGINTVHGKNMIGAFYEPEHVILNLSYLNSLPQEEWFNGKVEMLKIGMVADRDFFYRFSTFTLEEAIKKSRQLKEEIVFRDPFEKTSIRQLLNLGHTLGHAIETASNYRVCHGLAVATGLVLEARISYEMGLLPFSILEIIEKTFPIIDTSYCVESVLEALSYDKKSYQGNVHFVLLKDIGDPIVSIRVSLDCIKRVLYDTSLCSR